jgi:hypothetical protein
MVVPYPKGIYIIKWWFSILFCIYCVVIVFRYLWYYCSIWYSSIWNLTIIERDLTMIERDTQKGREDRGEEYCKNCMNY